MKNQEWKEYVLIAETRLNDYGLEVEYFTADLMDEAEHGYIDENGEFIACENGEFVACEYPDSSAARISWWDGSDTQERYRHVDQLQFRTLKLESSEKTDLGRGNQVYTDTYVDEDGDKYISGSLGDGGDKFELIPK